MSRQVRGVIQRCWEQRLGQASIPSRVARSTPITDHGTPKHTVSQAREERQQQRSAATVSYTHLVAVRLGVPVVTASRGLSPPSHFPVGFRLPVASVGDVQFMFISLAGRHARRTRVAPGVFAPEALARSGRGDFHLSGSSVNVSRHLALAALPKEVSVTCLPVVLASVMVLSFGSHPHGPPLLRRVRGAFPFPDFSAPM